MSEHQEQVGATPLAVPYSAQVLRALEVLAPMIAGTTEDQWAVGFSLTLPAMAQNFAEELGADPAKHQAAIVRALAARHLGVSADGVLLLRGRLEDIARHLLHVLMDPTAAAPVVLAPADAQRAA